MKRFLNKTLLFVLAFVAINLILQLTIPKDENSYFCEYNHKVKLLEDTPSPRIIFVGGSSIPFCTNTKTMMDSLHINIVDFGLIAGIGIKYPVEDCLNYVKKGDFVVLQIEYENFFNGGNGEPESFFPFMVSTNWRNVDKLNFHQWRNIMIGVPQEAIKNLKRLVNYLSTKSFNTPAENNSFAYVKSGFNEYGDEVGHLQYPNMPENIYKKEDRNVDNNFIEWLNKAIQQYDQAGAKVILLPPACVTSHFNAKYHRKISESLNMIHHPYIVEPNNMVLDDSVTFNTGYHVDAEGIKQNTSNIIKIFKEKKLINN